MRYKSEDYFTVINKKTGLKISDCGNENDAIMMVSFDPNNRTYTRNKFLMGQVVDVEIQKQLPTNEIVVVSKESNASNKKLKEYTNKLAQSDLEPLKL